MNEHEHLCQHCRRRFPCDCRQKKAGYEVDIAARINGQGPYCEMCRHLIMAQRYAANRGNDAVRLLVEQALAKAKSNLPAA